jgi:hypothetical protein
MGDDDGPTGLTIAVIGGGGRIGAPLSAASPQAQEHACSAAHPNA